MFQQRQANPQAIAIQQLTPQQQQQYAIAAAQQQQLGKAPSIGSARCMKNVLSQLLYG